MKSNITICYYISGHGLGHAARDSQVIRKFPKNCRVLVRTCAPANFIRRESGREVEVSGTRADVTPTQLDNRSIDWQSTAASVLKAHENRRSILREETDFLRSENVDVVISDISAMAFPAAAAAGVPASALGNFTWADILEPEIDRFPRLEPVIAQWQSDYATARCMLRCGLNLPMDYFPEVCDIGLIGRCGNEVRSQLATHLNLAPGSKIVLLYFGIYDADEDFIPDLPGTHFIAFSKGARGVVSLDPSEWYFPDVLASVDCVIAKPGYGTISECMANGIPVVYHPRSGFAEYTALHKGLIQWGGAVEISNHALESGNWSESLEKAMLLKPVKVPAPGAKAAADHVMQSLAAR